MAEKTPFIKAVDEVTEFKLRIADKFIKEYIEPLLDVGSPEKLINKKYEDWDDADRQRLSIIYGDKLEDYIFTREYKKVRELEEGL